MTHGFAENTFIRKLQLEVHKTTNAHEHAKAQCPYALAINGSRPLPSNGMLFYRQLKLEIVTLNH